MRACIVPIGTPAYTALIDAISARFDGAEVLPTREGGSGPEALLQQAIGAPLVFLGVGLPDDQIHAPNEKVNLSMLLQGRRGGRAAVGQPGGAGTRRARVGRAALSSRNFSAFLLPRHAVDDRRNL